MSSRYNPIRETFTSGDIVSINPLSGNATPPADIDFSGAGIVRWYFTHPLFLILRVALGAHNLACTL